MNLRIRRSLPTIVLAVAVYGPLLLTARGKVGADTKAYLYLDPDRLLSRAWSMWDPASGLGGLSHQTIGYLWPMGPWFWVAEHAGLPDWVAQRLWLGTILFAAGVGTRWLLERVLGWRTAPAMAAAFVYACTPYVLSLAARISVILLPFAGLPWLLGLTILAVRRGGWRYPALFALVVATVGSVNATALALVGLAPLWWLVHARVTGAITTGRAAAAVGRIAVLSVAVNLWWIGGLWAQSGYGINILRYTETAQAINTASNGVELLRGLGYWFFYGGDRLGPWIEPAVDYTQRLPLLVLTFALPVGALLAFGLVRFRERTFAAGLVVIGLLAAVGAHPYGDPPLTGRFVRAFLDTDTGLAMRSLPRAVPLLALGMAMALGSGAAALGPALARWRPSLGNRVRPAYACAAVAVLAYAALPPLWTGGMVAHNLDRPEDVPGYWRDAAAYLDSRDDGTRVLELPGAEFASYRWGNTVDPISPGLMDRPQAAHELIPYGSPPSADLLAALDARLQERTLGSAALVDLARLLGAGDILLRDDLQFERYRTPRPYTIAPFLASAPGLEPPVPFGDPVVNQPVASAPLDDELALSARGGASDVARPPLEVFGVTDPLPIVRTHPDAQGVVVAGDGSGLVDLAEAGIVGFDQLFRYAASLTDEERAAAFERGADYVITDGNRRQGRRWSTVRDLYGLVEPPPSLSDDPSDNRLPLFPDAGEEWQTTTAGGEVSVAATSYGNPISFTPEFRPANAVDGDPGTEWRTGADADVVGERLELMVPDGSSASAIRFVQQLTGARNRHLTAVDVRIDGGPTQRVALDASSLTAAGQEVALDHAGSPFHELTIELAADSTGRRSRWGRPQRFVGLTQVGFAEISLVGDPAAADQALVLPRAATEAIDADVPVSLVLSRWRTDPTDAVRQDPEVALARRWSLPVPRSFAVSGTARLTPDALDPVIDRTLGATGPAVSSSTRLIGVPAARASSAFDGDPATWWSPSFFDEQPWVEAAAAAPVTIDRVVPVLVDDGVRSLATQLSVSADGGAAVVVDVPASGAEVLLPAPMTGTTFRFTVTALAPRTSIDWFSQRPILVPPAIAELGVPAGLVVSRPPVVDTGCRSDLLAVDGARVPIRVTGSTADALAGVGFAIEGCDAAPLRIDLGAGAHDLRAGNGLATGLDLDQVVLRSEGSARPPVLARGPSVEVLDDDGWKVRVRVTGATAGSPFWLVLGQSFNLGWEVDGEEPELVDGFANGWRITPDADTFEVTMTWAPQRVVNVGLVGSAVGVVVGLVLLLRRRRSQDDVLNVVDDAPRGGLVAVAVVTVASVLAIGPVAAVIVGVVGVAAWRWPLARRALGLLPAATYGLAASYVVLRQAVSKPSPAFEWPAEQATAHQPALVAIAFLVLAISLRDERAGARPPAR